MGFVVQNGPCDLSLNPERYCFYFYIANTLEKDVNPTGLPLAIGLIVRQTGLFILGMATGLKEERV